MSLTHASRVLTLESQTELLERLQLLTNFGSNLIAVSGASGAGKSWLAQHYLEVWAEHKNQALLLCHPSQDDNQHRSTLIHQLLSNPLFNPSETLSESLTRLLDEQSCDLVIVVDDAQLLSEGLLSELWSLVQQAHTNPAWTINVVLFSQSGCLDSVLGRLAYGQEQKPIELEIDPLSDDDADRFFEQLVMRFVEPDREKHVRNAYRNVGRLPGAIMALGEQKVEKRIVIRSIVGSPTKIALLVVLLVVLLAGGYWWLLGQPSPQDKADQLTSGGQQTVIPTLAGSEGRGNKPTESVLGELSERDSGVEDDSSALPPDVVSQSASVGDRSDSQQRVVITSEVVDALLEGKPQKADTQAIDQLVAQAGTTAASADASSALASQPVDTETPAAIAESEQAALEQDSTPETQSSEPAVIRFSFAQQELKAFSPRSYTLQLAAMQSLQDVQQFLDRYQLQGKVRIYPTIRNDVEWYIVTYDNYPTIQLARDAVATLPKALQRLDPWAKSLSQVHREIDRVK